MAIGVFFFFFNDTATTEIYTLSLHDALPICCEHALGGERLLEELERAQLGGAHGVGEVRLAAHHDHREVRCAALELLERSEEHTSELQSRLHLVCRLLLEKKKTPTQT